MRKTRYLFLVVVGLFLGGALVGCRGGWPGNHQSSYSSYNPPMQPAAAMPAYVSSAPAADWTCPMHPQIHQSQPGKCPLCGMDLTRAQSSGQSSGGGGSCKHCQ